jgi:hypothetical protein
MAAGKIGFRSRVFTSAQNNFYEIYEAATAGWSRPSVSSLRLANCYFASLSRLKMPSGANAFEISDIQEDETEV